MIEKYKRWLEKNEWYRVLNELRQSELGFSFNECVPKPLVTVKAESGYLNKMQELERQYVEIAYGVYQEKYALYESGLADYKEIGQQFFLDVTDPTAELYDVAELMAFSEECDHLFHNAAVLWLEDHESDVAELQRPSYEETLKLLWFLRLLLSLPDQYADFFNVDTWSERLKALARYTLGRDANAWSKIPHCNQAEFLAESQKYSHVTLGKVLLRRETSFHADWSIRAHPGFWGLFLVSPYNNGDRGFFNPGKLDADTLKWIELLTLPPFKNDENPDFFRNRDEGFQIYERVPRLFLDNMTLPGVYLHRSKAHGRDDFLALVKDDSINGRRVMLACTKGVGGDPNLIPESLVSNNVDMSEFKKRFNEEESYLLPITYPTEIAKTTDSWANVGFCAAMGKHNEEMANIDFEHFGELSNAIRRARPLAGLSEGIVEPFVCIEISRFRHNFERLPVNLRRVGFGVEEFPTAGPVSLLPERALIGFPVQIVTVAPCETSLRIYKTKGSNSKQNYDYDCPALELEEWHRCYKHFVIPGEDEQDRLMEIDLSKLRVFLLKNQVWAHNPDGYNTVIQLDEYFDHDQKEIEELYGEAVDTILAPVLPKMRIIFRILHGVAASYISFLNLDWASDSYTGSFSGRNYNSGPRDSNEWGDFIRSSSQATGTTPAGEGPFCGSVDAGQLGGLVGFGGDLIQEFDLRLRRLPLSPIDWSLEDGLQLWEGFVLYGYLTSFNRLMTQATERLRGLAEEYRAQLLLVNDESFGALNKRICLEYRTWLRKEAESLPSTLGVLFQALRT